MNWIFNKLFEFFIGRFFKKLEKNYQRETVDFAAAKQALENGDAEPVSREWQRVSTRLHSADMIADNHEIQVAKLWGDYQMAQRNWDEAGAIFERGLTATSGLATERFELLFRLADTLFWRGRAGEVYQLLHEHPITGIIERMGNNWPAKRSLYCRTQTKV